MFIENKAEFEKTNISLWRYKGYTGKGITIAVLDDNGMPRKFDNVITPLNDSKEDTNHKSNVCGVIREVAPEVRILAFNWFGGDKEAIVSWLEEHKDEVDIVNCSFSSAMTSTEGYMKRIYDAGITICASSGNGSNNRLSRPARFPTTIAFGAFEEFSDRLAYYSNGGDSLDAVAFTNIYIKTDTTTGKFPFNGTSCSSPVGSGMLSLYLQSRLENKLPKIHPDDSKKFVQFNTRDLYEVGFDIMSGYGLFKLPSETPVIEVEPIKEVVIIEEPIKEPIVEKTSDIIIDISHHQVPSNIDYDKLSKQVGLVVIRTQYGSRLIDKHYKAHHSEFKKRGVPTASYAWVRGTSIKDMEVEANDFYNRTKDLNPSFWFLDVEEKSMPDMRNGVKAYVNKLRSLGVKKIGIYIAHHLYKDFNLDFSIVDAIWIPHYGLNNGTLNSKPSYFCDIHQYTSEGRLDGYAGDLDLNKIISGIPLSYYTKESIEPVVEPVIVPVVVPKINKPVLLTYARVLKYGSKGEDVKALQVALTTLGYYSNLIDGSFGGLTNIAIRNLQRGTGITVDGLVGPLTIHTINLLLSVGVTQSSKAKYYRVGNAHIIETDPENIEIKILGNTLSNAKVYGVNGTFFDTPNPTLPNSCWAIATNEGKPIGGNSMLVSYATTIKRGTIAFYEDGSVEVLKVNSINEFKKPHRWSISGYTVYPSYDFKAEKMPSGIDYETAHTYIGFKGKSIYLIVKPSHMIKDIVPLVKQLGLEGCIVLDGGGSTQLRHPNGSYNSSRKINSAVLLKEI